MSAVPKSDQPVLLREDRDGICTLTFNRPQQMNLLTGEMLAALQDEFNKLKTDLKTRVVILAATGKGFSAGHDLKEIRALKELPKTSTGKIQKFVLREKAKSAAAIDT